MAVAVNKLNWSLDISIRLFCYAMFNRNGGLCECIMHDNVIPMNFDGELQIALVDMSKEIWSINNYINQRWALEF